MSGVHVDGTFRQYMVSSARYVTRIPVELDMAEAAPVLCAGVTCLRGLKEAKLSIGDWVAIPGAGGGLGHLAVQYALALGHRVVGIDTGADKRALVEGYGAKFIDFKESSVSERLAVSWQPVLILCYRTSWLPSARYRVVEVFMLRWCRLLRRELMLK